MKKQILFLALFSMAFFASVNRSYGQAVHGNADPRPTTCASDALHPIAGVPYTYTVATTPGLGQYTWWATKSDAFIVNGDHQVNLDGRLTTTSGDLTAVSANYGLPGGATNADNVSITWSSRILAGTGYQNSDGKTSTFVAVHYNAPDGCTDNFKVFELDPKNGFVVDILNLDDATVAPINAAAPYDQVESQCFDQVSSANYVAPNMVYEYGTNIMYFEVVAANFSVQWTPTFQLSGLLGDQTASIDWGTTVGTYNHNVTTNTFNGTFTSPDAVTTALTDTHLGVSIYVRVTITNHHYEGLANSPIALAVDGQNNEGLWDVRNDDCLLPTPNAADQNDTATQTLTLRPTVVEGTTSTIPTNVGIIPKNP